MPSAPLRYCAEFPRCRERTATTRCPTHTTARRKIRNVEFDERLYRQKKWLDLRLEVIGERPECEDKGPNCRILSQEVHHKVKRTDDLGLFYDRDNLMALCRPCHSERTSRGE
jgi:5-methylcytosine-specific restriction protein A